MNSARRSAARLLLGIKHIRCAWQRAGSSLHMLDAEHEQITQTTRVCHTELVPEISLHLITPACPLWTRRPEESPFREPFWAFFWPGGQALARYILDHPSVVKGKKVLDVGSGSGACAIAAAKAGAKRVVANDTDPVAVAAITLNAHLNKVDVETSEDNLIGLNLVENDLVLFGDMFYDADSAQNILMWIKMLRSGSRPVDILVGDPGRWSFSNMQASTYFNCVAKHELPLDCKEENSGFSLACVWKAK